MIDFALMIIVVVAPFIALIVAIVLLIDIPMSEREFPLSRKIEKARMMSEEYRK